MGDVVALALCVRASHSLRMATTEFFLSLSLSLLFRRSFIHLFRPPPPYTEADDDDDRRRRSVQFSPRLPLSSLSIFLLLPPLFSSLPTPKVKEALFIPLKFHMDVSVPFPSFIPPSIICRRHHRLRCCCCRGYDVY